MKRKSGDEWITKDRKTIPISEMTDKHLLNAIAFVRRRAKEGVDAVFSLGYGDHDYIEYGCFTIYGQEVEDHFNLEALLKEKESRKSLTSTKEQEEK